uniref:Uncharacterized protein n=1 Tax=Oryza rufipogon TaxID=4529 RepID=A0A0E0N230_ORYRU
MAPESGRGFAFAGDRRRRRPLREPSALRSAAAARSDRAREAREAHMYKYSLLAIHNISVRSFSAVHVFMYNNVEIEANTAMHY